MTAPKGVSKRPQSCLYKNGKTVTVEQHEVEDLMADGWCDNPAEEKSEVQVLREKNAELEAAAEKPEKVEADGEETPAPKPAAKPKAKKAAKGK